MVAIIKDSRRYITVNSLYAGYKFLSAWALPDLHVLNAKGKVKQDYLYPIRKGVTPETPSNQCSLAGHPVPAEDLQLLREDVVEKWNQKPDKDIYKEMVKKTYTY